MRNTLTGQEVNDLRQSAVRDWRDFTPGVYKYVYAYNGLNEYDWIVVTSITPDGRFFQVTLGDPTVRQGCDPVIWASFLTDAGVVRDEKGKYGSNFVVKYEKVVNYR